MKIRSYIVILGASAIAALGTPVAQAALLGGEGSHATSKATLSTSTLKAMLKAGTGYHASAKIAFPRPDDRAGVRGA